MTASDFWRELAEKFQKLDPNGTLRAQWSLPCGDQSREFWQLIVEGNSGPSMRARFEPLAIRAGSMLKKQAKDVSHAKDISPLEIWLTEVKEYGPKIDFFGPSGSDLQDSGCITNLCQVSADLCSVLESRALDEEYASDQDLRLSAFSGRPSSSEETVLESGGLENKAKPDSELPPPSSPSADKNSEQRRKRVDEFLHKCNEISQIRVRRRHLWRSVEHSRARQFEYWQRCDPKATAEDDKNFNRILGMKPEHFVLQLRQQGLLK